MKFIRKLLIVTPCLVLFGHQAFALEVIGADAGDGGDTQETTFHFDTNNVDFQMTLPDGTPLSTTGVLFRYGSALQIFNNNVDYITSQGLQVQGADLSGTNWTNTAFPVQGTVAIDPAIGRFKFSATAWRGAGLIDAGGGNTAFEPQIASNDNQNAICVFRQGLAIRDRVYANVFIPNLGWQGASLIDANTGQDATEPQIAMNENGKAFCVFTQYDGANNRVYANEYVPGLGWQNAGLIDAGAGNTARDPQIAINGAGSAFCVFIQWNGGSSRVYANEYVPGAGWYGAVTIDADTGNDAYEPQIAINESGKAICAFRQNDGADNRVYAIEYVPGAGWQSAGLIDAGPGNTATVPQIAMNDSGNAFCVFRQNLSTDDRIYANEFISGIGWQGASLVDAGAGQNAFNPQIAMNAAGNAFCVFRQSDGLDPRIYANEYIPGAGWQGASLIDAGAGQNAVNPQIAINGTGSAFCTFSQQAGGVYRIYINKYIPGAGWQGADLIDAGPEHSAEVPQIAMNGNGRAFCVFLQRYVGDDRVFANAYLGDIPVGSIQVYYNTSSASSPTPVISENRVVITNRRIEPLRSERLSLQLDLTQAGKTTIKIYNLQGRLVKTLINEYLAAGSHTFDWTAVNDSGDLIASGVYIIRVQAPGISETQKVVVIK